MKTLPRSLGVIGSICLLSAAGNDDLSNAAGSTYPLAQLLAWAACGFACMGAAWAIHNLNTQKN